jgi:dienelactone hydrolase
LVQEDYEEKTMFGMLALIAVAAAGGTGVIWVDGADLADGMVDVPRAGTYTVWAWVKGDGGTEVTLGSDSLSLEGIVTDSEASRYDWVEAGEVALPQGQLKASCEGPVAALFLSTDADARPEDAMAVRRVFDQPQTPPDVRLSLERDTNTLYEMTPFADRAAWESFADALRRKLLVSSGLLPLPNRTPLNPSVTAVATHDDYIVEKVSIEAMPGFLVTGNLYRPAGDGPFPAVACPHGHWSAGRLANEERGSVPGRCITLARMGIVAFSYDMVGYVDSQQIPHGGGDSPEEQRLQALWGIHPFAFQLWSSIRVLDFLESLPYVDPDKLNCTGASGGGTQTFALTGVDQRVKVAAPVNMISHSMQGGCPCENAPIIRFAASNMEVGALAAPRPMMMVSASGDWTKKTPEVEYPAIKGIYELYGAGDRVENVHVDAGHNYNQTSREAVYRFFGKWILGKGEEYAEFEEPAFELEPVEALRLFPDKGLPEGMKDAETIVAEAIEQRREKWTAVLPKSAADLDAFRADYGVALADVTGVSVPDSVSADKKGEVQREGFTAERLVLSRTGEGDAIPALLFRPANPKGSVLVVHGDGKAALADTESNGPGALVRALLGRGKVVLAIDPFLRGEYNSLDHRAERVQKKFPDTFVPSDTACRIQDVVTALAYLGSQDALGDAVDLIGLADGGMWCLFASALCNVPGTTVVDANQFANDDDAAWVERHYVPCLRSIGDVATAAALIAPRGLCVVNTGDAFDASGMKRVYDAVSGKALRVEKGVVAAEDLAALVAKVK